MNEHPPRSEESEAEFSSLSLSSLPKYPQADKTVQCGTYVSGYPRVEVLPAPALEVGFSR